MSTAQKVDKLFTESGGALHRKCKVEGLSAAGGAPAEQRMVLWKGLWKALVVYSFGVCGPDARVCGSARRSKRKCVGLNPHVTHCAHPRPCWFAVSLSRGDLSDEAVTR